MIDNLAQIMQSPIPKTKTWRKQFYAKLKLHIAETDDVEVLLWWLSVAPEYKTQLIEEKRTKIHLVNEVAKKKSVNVLKTLLELGLKPESKNEYRKDLMVLMVDHNWLEGINILHAYEVNKNQTILANPLFEAVKRRKGACIEDVVKLPWIDMEGVDNRGKTPLWIAIDRHDAASVGTLLECGANPHLKTGKKGQASSPFELFTSRVRYEPKKYKEIKIVFEKYLLRGVAGEAGNTGKTERVKRF